MKHPVMHVFLPADELVWIGSVCRHVEPVQNVSRHPAGDDGYEEGDDEPCVYCEHADCVAVVTRREVSG